MARAGTSGVRIMICSGCVRATVRVDVRGMVRLKGMLRSRVRVRGGNSCPMNQSQNVLATVMAVVTGMVRGMVRIRGMVRVRVRGMIRAKEPTHPG